MLNQELYEIFHALCADLFHEDSTPKRRRRNRKAFMRGYQAGTVSSNSQTNWFAGVDNKDQPWYSTLFNAVTGVQTNVGDLCYNGGNGAAYPAGQMTTTGTEQGDQEKFANLFVGCTTESILAAETNATRQINIRVQGPKMFTCPSQVFGIGQLVGIYSNGTTIDPTQVDALAGGNTLGAIGWVIPFPGNPGYYSAAVTQVYVYFVSRVAGECPPLSFINTSAEPAIFPRNAIDGGDFTVNPMQRGTTFTAITNTVTYTADRFFAVGGASSSISVSQQAQTDVIGFANSLRFGRANANADTAKINLGQVLETLDCTRFQGQQVTLSFWAKAGATFLTSIPAGFKVQVNHSVTAGNDTAAHLAAASTNWQAVPTVVNSTVIPTALPVRYSFTGYVPATCTQLGVVISYTPVGTAGATEFVDFYGFQLEAGGQATAFEHRDVEMELALCQRYYFRIVEANGATFAIGAPAVGANLQTYSIWLPTPMRVAPTTVTWTVGGFKLIIDGAANASPTTPTAGSTHSPTIITLTTANVLTAAAHSVALVGTGTTGFIDASADL